MTINETILQKNKIALSIIMNDIKCAAIHDIFGLAGRNSFCFKNFCSLIFNAMACHKKIKWATKNNLIQHKQKIIFLLFKIYINSANFHYIIVLIERERGVGVGDGKYMEEEICKMGFNSTDDSCK